MITVKQLIEFLGSHQPEAEVRWFTGQGIKHVGSVVDPDDQSIMVILADHRPIGYCLKCGNNVFNEEDLNYVAYCPNCGENKYSFEIEEKPFESNQTVKSRKQPIGKIDKIEFTSRLDDLAPTLKSLRDKKTI